LTAAYLVKFAISAIAVAMMVAITAWATRARSPALLDETSARRWLAVEFPNRALDGLWIADDANGAIARSGDDALVLSRLGAGWVARQVAWSQVMAAPTSNGRLDIHFGDVTAPRAVLALNSWPPQEAMG